MEKIFKVATPKKQDRIPLICDSPHSGRHYPPDFFYSCPREDLERAEDNYVDELFPNVAAEGGTMLAALFPRTYIDVNRAEDDIDEALLSAAWPERISTNGRSHAGIGLIRRLVRPGMPVYDRALAPEEVLHRINNYYRPYHDTLENLLSQAHYDFGQVWHINCHSMPSSARRLPHGILAGQPDFVLGDRDGTSCDLAFRQTLAAYLKDRGFKVAINDPYKGVEILRRYGHPASGWHSLQLEINKGLYWNEQKGVKSEDFNVLQDEIKSLVSFCSSYIRQQLSTALAAD